MASMTFDNPQLLAAMATYLEACTATAAATDDAELLSRSDVMATAGMSLRKRLVELGWTAPVSQRTST